MVKKSLTGAEVKSWGGCHGYFLPIARFANLLIRCTAPACPPIKKINTDNKLFNTATWTNRARPQENWKSE